MVTAGKLTVRDVSDALVTEVGALATKVVLIARSKLRLQPPLSPFKSVLKILMVRVPKNVGVPVISPVLESKLNPVGKVPEPKAYVKGPLPPLRVTLKVIG